MTSDHRDAIAKIRADLAWRGPTGRVMGYVVLERHLGEALIAYLEENKKGLGEETEA